MPQRCITREHAPPAAKRGIKGKAILSAHQRIPAPDMSQRCITRDHTPAAGKRGIK
jgi:hypothetical protein